jgi:hypothetical protein
MRVVHVQRIAHKIACVKAGLQVVFAAVALAWAQVVRDPPNKVNKLVDLQVRSALFPGCRPVWTQLPSL